MKRTIRKSVKVSLCRECNGTGYVIVDGGPATCAQCEGSGRVTVSGVMELDIRPFKPTEK